MQNKTSIPTVILAGRPRPSIIQAMNPADDAITEAQRAGFDLDLLDFNLALSPDERLRQHESARKLCQTLREAGAKHARTQHIDSTAAGREI